jgi:hypothetical protein
VVANEEHAQIYEESVMTNIRKQRRRGITMGGLAFGLTMLLAMASTYADSSGQPTFHGKTYGEWSAKWWQWIRSIPDLPGQPNPLRSTGRIDCSIGQAGPVFFLAGTTGGDPVERTCKRPVPAGKALFLSPLNFLFYNDLNDPPPPVTEAEKRDLLDSIISDSRPGPFNSRACNIVITVDGVSTVFSALTTARTQSPAFRLAIGEHDVFGGTAGSVDRSAVSDGFWVMLRLPKGRHTLHVQGALCDIDTNEPLGAFQQDYTYHLRVE